MVDIKGLTGLAISGQQIPVKDCNIFITQPTVRDIIALGENDYFLANSFICHTGDYTKDLRKGNLALLNMSNFQILLMMVQQKELGLKEVCDKFFSLVFPDYKVIFTEDSIDFAVPGQNDKLHLVGRVTPFTFESFYETLCFVFEPKSSEDSYNPEGDLAEQIAEKLKKGREKVNQMKGIKTEQATVFGNMASCLAVGMHMDINYFFQLTPFQLYDIHRRYNLKEQNDFYKKVASTPLMDVSHMEEPTNWMEDLYL